MTIFAPRTQIRHHLSEPHPPTHHFEAFPLCFVLFNSQGSKSLINLLIYILSSSSRCLHFEFKSRERWKQPGNVYMRATYIRIYLQDVFPISKGEAFQGMQSVCETVRLSKKKSTLKFVHTLQRDKSERTSISG